MDISNRTSAIANPTSPDGGNVETHPKMFTSSLMINKIKTPSGYINVQVKADHDGKGETSSIHSPTADLPLGPTKTNTADMKIKITIKSLSDNVNAHDSMTGTSGMNVYFDSSEVERLRLKKKQLELEDKRLDTEFRKTDKNGWMEKEKRDLRKLELKLEIEKHKTDRLSKENNKQKQSMSSAEGDSLNKFGESNPISTKSQSDCYAVTTNALIEKPDSTTTPAEVEKADRIALPERPVRCNLFNKVPDDAANFKQTSQYAEHRSQEVGLQEEDNETEEVSLKKFLKTYVSAIGVLEENLECHYGLLDLLFSSKLITDRHYSDIRRDYLNPFQCNQRLLDYVTLGNNFEQLEDFLTGLNDTKQSHLATFLRSKLDKQDNPNTDGDWPLDCHDKNLLVKLHSFLVEQMSPTEMVDALYQKKCIGAAHSDSIQEQRTRRHKNRELLFIMRHRSKRDLKRFLETLKEYHEHLQELLNIFSDSNSSKSLLKLKTARSLKDDQVDHIFERMAQIAPLTPTTKLKNTGLKENSVFSSEGNLYLIVDDTEENIPSKIQSDEIISAVTEAISTFDVEDVKIVSVENVELDETKERVDFLPKPKQVDNVEYQITCTPTAIDQDLDPKQLGLNIKTDQCVDRYSISRSDSAAIIENQSPTPERPVPERRKIKWFRRNTIEIAKYLTTNDSKKIFSGKTEINMTEHDTSIVGVAVIDYKIFVVRYKKSEVLVYHSITLKPLSNMFIEVPEMKSPAGLAGCSYNQVLYISDDELMCIHKVGLSDNSVKRWDVKEKYETCGLTVTLGHNVLATLWIKDTNDTYRGESRGDSRVVEYTTDGLLVREIELDKSIDYASQTLELSTDQFIICHGWISFLHRVCIINSKGQIMKYFGGERGGGEGQLNRPWSLTLDRSREIVFVADRYNRRVVMLDYDLTYLGVVESTESLSRSSSLYFYLKSDQLIIGERYRPYRLIIISPDRSVTV